MIGKHVIAELTGCDAGILNDPETLRQAMTEAVKLAGATLLQLHHEQFTPQGVTAVAILSESHLSIHTWPETGYCALDVFTCGDHTMPAKAAEEMARKLKAQGRVIKELQRGLYESELSPDSH